ncbi:TPA: phage portal protein [Escherichia coli]|nr:phage portal protein [Escherichia coli]HBA3784753.1 phage portal protein [Escherichia coli]
MTSLREYAGYHGGGSGFGGQLRAWNPPGESVDAALLPNFTRGNARADDLVRNNGYAANAIQLHQDHIVGSFFRLSHRPSWRYLGIGEEEARAFSREVEAAWKEFAEDDCCCIDVERKRTFTMMIREGVAMHAFNGELFVQATWDTSSSRLFRTQFRMVSPKRISNPNNTGDSRNCRAGVQINDSGAALGYYVSEDGYPGWMPQKWTWIPRELPGGRASFIHVFEPVEDGQTRGANVFYSVMEQMKMLDTLQNTQLQSAIVKAMYAATIESELDTQSAMDFILGCDNQQRRRRVTAELRNLPHIASMAFNEPLMLEPAYARVFFCALAGQLGISRLTDAVSGDSLTAQEALATLALSGDDDGPRQARSYQVMNGIAVLPVSGTLVSRTRALQPYSGMTGYNGIIARLQQAASDPMVDGILLDMDTPGGMVAGAFDCADIIARVRDIKPVWALANDMNCSAGQLLASAASRRLVTQTARTGSIGVMMAHSNYGAALEKQGVEITLIYSGSHKVDGNPYSHLPDDVRETLQSRMDATRQMFAQKVSAYTGLSVQAVLDTEAAVYSGQEAIDAGLADELVNSTDAITVMRDALDARKSRLSGGRMTKETQSTTVSATASQADVTDVVPATEGENASAAQPDVNAQITAAVAAENSRIMGILNCEEAHGREEQARVLAETPGMTVETARRILAAAPQSAQARSDTALDRLMQGAPAPLAAGNPASDAVNDLLNTPV